MQKSCKYVGGRKPPKKDVGPNSAESVGYMADLRACMSRAYLLSLFGATSALLRLFQVRCVRALLRVPLLCV